MTVYEWKDGCRLKGDAQRIGEKLDALEAKLGELTAEAVLQEASKLRSPLHAYFEWDDTEAAHQHRLAQARHLMRSVVVRYEREEQEPLRVRAFVQVAEPAYMSTEKAMRTPDLRAQVLAQARKELAAWRRRYADLQEFADLIDVIDTTLEAA